MCVGRLRCFLSVFVAVFVFSACEEITASRKGGCFVGSLNISTNISRLPETNATIMLPNGNYCVESYIPVVSKQGFTLSSVSGNPEDVVIRCAEGVGLGFFNISQHVHIYGVTISGCGLTDPSLSQFLSSVNETLNVFYNAVHNSSFAVIIAASQNVDVKNTRVNENTGFGLLAISLYGNSVFTEAEFVDNRAPGGTVFSDDFLRDGRAFGGGVIFHFHDWHNKPDSVQSANVSIANCTFSGNVNYYSAELAAPFMAASSSLKELGYVLSGAAGITVKLCQYQYGVDFLVNNTLISGNRAQIGGGAVIGTFVDVVNSTIEFVNCKFLGNENSTEISTGMGLTLILDLLPWHQVNTYVSQYDKPTTVLFDSCQFIENEASTGGGLFVINSVGPMSRLPLDLVFRNCNFHENKASCGAAVSIHTYKGVAFNYFVNNRVVFDRCNFTSNTVTAPSTFSASLTGSGAIQLRNAFVILKDTLVKDTNGSGLESVDSTVQISGRVEFSNNSAVFGGGAQMIGLSFFVATNHSRLIFHRNTAYQDGGGIYFVLPQNIVVGSRYFDCFLYFDSIDFYCTKGCSFQDLNFTLSFENNTAKQGSMIKGALLDTCVWAYDLGEPFGPGGYNKLHTIEYLNIHHHDVFQFDEPFHPSGVNTGAVDPKVRVKSNNSTVVSMMPGEEVEVIGDAVDVLGNSVADVLLAVVQGQKFVDTNPTIEVTVGSNGLWRIENESTSFLHVDGPENCSGLIGLTSITSQATTSLSVKLTNCQPGFNYSSGTKQCNCDSILDQYGEDLKCFTTNASFAARLGYWFGDLDGGLELGRDVSKYVLTLCGTNACKNPLYTEWRIASPPNGISDSIDYQYINPRDLDSQCLPNRRGLLCGKCKPGFSVILGTVECSTCDGNSGIAIIALFAIMGILLMAVVTISDFHVSSGYINGLILYSNIIDIYYVEIVKRNVPFSILTIYEWLSLRWGIPVCFTQGLDHLSQAGLEFVFPLYIGILLILITLMARYCPIPQKVRNVINLPRMFATTLFLTFGAILSSSIRILHFVVIWTASGDWHVRWRRDPHVLYFQELWHIILGILSIAVVVYLIGVTAMLIIPERFFRLSWLRRKFKPIIDVFQAPFRDTYICRTWEGWRMLFRVLVIFIGFFPIISQLWILVFVLLVFHYIQASLHPYRGEISNWLDSFFLMVLIVTFLFYIGLDSFDISVHDLIFLIPFYIIQSVVLLVVFGILLKSFFKCFQYLFFTLKSCAKKKASEESNYTGVTESTSLRFNEYSIPGESTLDIEDVHVQNYGSLRSSLLAYDSDDEDDKEMRNISK